MKQRIDLVVEIAADQALGDRVLVAWTGRHGKAEATEEVQVSAEPVFRHRAGRYGKGLTPKGRGTKAGGAAPELVAGKGQMPKGMGPKGGSLRMVRATVLVPPVAGLRTFKATAYDLAGNEQSSGNPELTVMLSETPARPGPLTFVSYDAGADTVTVRAGDRMY